MPAYITKKHSSRTTDHRYNYEISPDIKLPIIRLLVQVSSLLV